MPPASAAARPWWCGGISGGTSSAPVSGWRGTLRPTWSGSYTARRFTLEFGQPFLSLDDAQTFFRLYSRDGAVPSRQELAQRLELSAWADYPLYLPNPKPLCLLAIPAAQLREEMYG